MVGNRGRFTLGSYFLMTYTGLPIFDRMTILSIKESSSIHGYDYIALHPCFSLIPPLSSPIPKYKIKCDPVNQEISWTLIKEEDSNRSESIETMAIAISPDGLRLCRLSNDTNTCIEKRLSIAWNPESNSDVIGSYTVPDKIHKLTYGKGDEFMYWCKHNVFSMRVS